MNIADPLLIPHDLRRAHAGWEATLAWAMTPLLATWRLTRARETRFLKLARTRWEPSLADERDRMVWANRRLPVPDVIDYGIAADVEWLLTASLEGECAAAAKDTRDVASLVVLVAQGLAAFHLLPVAECAFDFGLDAALAVARSRLERGLIDTSGFHAVHRHLDPRQAVEMLEEHRPSSEDAVVCHGDYCLPNVLVDGDRVTGYLDLGGLGVADRWWDLAVGTWSATWNLGDGWEDLFLEAYGIAPDLDRIAYYRLLYDVASGCYAGPG